MGKDSIGSFRFDNSLHLTTLAGSLMKALDPPRRNTAAIKWTFNASRNCEGHSLFQFLSGRPISAGLGRTQLTKLLHILYLFLLQSIPVLQHYWLSSYQFLLFQFKFKQINEFMRMALSLSFFLLREKILWNRK